MSDINEVEASVLRDLEKLTGRLHEIKTEDGHIIVLDISFSLLEELPESIGNLSNLQLLNISDNHLKELPESIGNLSKLEVLYISNNQLKELPESIGNLSNLQELQITVNQLKELPESIGNLSNLQSLNIYRNLLEELPESIGNLSNLQSLNIEDNQLKELPESIGNLSNLEDLSISDNQLKELPESIGNLSKLEVLYIGDNQLKELPESFGNLSKLETLFIDDNQLKELPESIGNLSNLQLLSISDNHLKELPESIGNLSNLQKLWINDNQLKELPGSNWNLPELQELRIGGNQFKELPESIGNLSNLQLLDIGDNQLKELPESIGNLSNLQKLYMDKNYIHTFPESILKMENIKDQIENSFNFALAFDYFPNKYLVNEGDTKEEINRKDRSNSTVQRHLFSKLANSAMKSYYWNFIIEFSWDYFNAFSIPPWGFLLYQIKSSKDKKQRELIKGENTIHLDHPARKNNFIELQMVIETPSPFLTPLIRSITVTAETDRGDSIPLVFTDFYYKWNEKVIKKIEFQKTVILKFDPGYTIEPFVKIDFKNIEVEYESTLLPVSPELAVIHSEIEKINKKFDLIMEFIEKQENFKFTSDKELKTYEERENSNIVDKKSKEIFEAFENGWLEPILPTVILEIGKRAGKIGKKIGSWLGKYAEYLAAGVIVASAIPPFLQFLYKLIVSPYQLGLDWLNWDLSQISIPVVFEILTYIPLILLFVYLTIIFLRKQKIPKDI